MEWVGENVKQPPMINVPGVETVTTPVDATALTVKMNW